MRFYEIDNPASGYREQQRPLVQPQPFAANVWLVLRFAPCVYRWVQVELHHGEPAADISIDRARMWFSEPYDAEGALSVHCRHRIIYMVQDEVERLDFSICALFASDDAVYVWPGKQPQESDRPPEGGLPL